MIEAAPSGVNGPCSGASWGSHRMTGRWMRGPLSQLGAGRVPFPSP